MPHGLKTPPIAKRRKKGFCKLNNFLGHKTSQCVLFRDLVHKALNEGKLQFGENLKSAMKVDSDPMHIEDAYYAEPVEILMVDATEGFNMEVDRSLLLMILTYRQCTSKPKRG